MATLDELFETQVLLHPEKTAVVFGATSLSYQELDERANQLAHFLSETKPETLIALCLDRSEWMIIAILGVLKARGAYVPIDPKYPDERIQFILENSGNPLVLTEEKYKNRLASFHASIVTVDSPGFLNKQPKNNPVVQKESSHLAYVIYTSGTTGSPKGVLQTHHNVCRLFKATHALFEFNSEDVWLLFHSYAFDFSVWEIWGALLYGGKLVIVSDSATRNYNELFALCLKEKVSILNQTPTSFSSFCDAAINEERLSSLRYVIFGGEKLHMGSLERWTARYGFKQPHLVNMYGITETTVHTTFKLITEQDLSRPLSNIGHVLTDLRDYVLDEQGFPAEEGELHIGGDGLARGYLNHPELTKDKFISNPYQTDEERKQGKNQRLYRTGDLVRRLGNGELEYLCRKDHQVKIRGYRIELGEIESVLCLYTGITQARVIMKGQEINKHLIGYYVSSEPIDETQLTTHLRNKLPEPFIPAFLIHLKQLPLTINGKLDESQLPEARWDSNGNPPQTEMENRMYSLWKEFFPSLVFGIDDPFFHLGGNSLLAIKLAVKIRQALGINVSYEAIFKNDTIKKLSIHLTENKWIASEIQPVNVSPETQFLSASQESLWFLQNYDKKNHAYHIPLVFKVCNQTDVPRLSEGLQKIITRHEVLRSWIKQDEEGRGYQLTGPVEFFRIESIACKDFNHFQFHLNHHLAQPFDLEEEYPVKAIFYELGANVYLAVIFHHIAFDGWSVGLFLNELECAYHDKKQLPQLNIQYRDYALWQRSRLHTASAEQREYWLRKFESYQCLSLLYDHKRPSQVDYKGATIHFELTLEDSRKLRRLASALNVSLYPVLLAGYALLMRLYSGQNEVIIGTPFANRHHLGVDALIGYFVNTLPLRLKVDPEMTVGSLIRQMSLEIAEIQIHQEFPLDKLIELLKVPKDESRHPLFQVMFGVQSFGRWGINNLLEYYDCSHLYNEAKFDLSTFIDDGQDCLKGEFNYRTSLFDEATIRGYVDTFVNLLHQIADSLEVPVQDIHYLPKQQFKQLAEWNQTETLYPDGKGIHHVFEEQVEKFPDQLAIVHQATRLTYKQLNEKANQLAHYLKTRYAFGSGSLAALCMERSELAIVALLGILKAGGAYVPIDTASPDERLHFILEDTAPSVVLVCENHKGRLEKISRFPLLEMGNERKLSSQPITNLALPFSSQKLAYVIYTSGTSGKPKGVLIEHQGVVNFISFYISKYQFKAQDAISQYLNLAFDAAGSEIYSALLSGAALHLVPESIRLDAVSLSRFIEDNRITFCVFPPAILGDLPLFQRPLRIVVMGDSCPSAIFEKWSSAGHQLINGYGPTEATIGSIETGFYKAGSYRNQVIGKPIANRKVYILDEKKRCQPIGVVGELYLGGVGIARGYLNQPQLTDEKFIQSPYDENSRLYKTGDLGRWLSNGEIEFAGRNDAQVKIRGFRIELLEIENALLRHPAIKQCAVIVRERSREKSLFAYYVSSHRLEDETIRNFLRARLPDYMIPAHFMCLEKLPLTANGKLDAKALPEIASQVREQSLASENSQDALILEAWAHVLDREPSMIGKDDNFFDIGGNSILIMRLKIQIEKRLGLRDIPISEFFKYPTIHRFSQRLAPDASEKNTLFQLPNGVPIAVVGASGEFPKSKNLQEFWDRLMKGDDCLEKFSIEKCRAFGIPEEVLNQEHFVPVEGILSGMDQFDPSFWQLSLNDASLMDPQIRKFLEHTWMALENAGEILDRSKKKIGVFAGAGANQDDSLNAQGASEWEARTMSREFLATRVSYLLGLTGPSLNINTACSTSLVAIVEACKNLQLGSCEVAIAGGVSFNAPEKYGYVYQEGMIFSKDGACRAFDHHATGTVRGSAVGVVVLKKLEDAVRDHNPILAIVRGYASNNDGNRKVGFAAPSAIGQTECILQAQSMAGVASDAVQFVECHGTGTPLGDPIEVQALSDAFSQGSSTKSYNCHLGSLKANMGHTDCAAGVGGFLKVCMMLKHRIIPPQIHFTNPNPALHLEKTGFHINTNCEEWISTKPSRLAGVSSFGIGGTNAHVILQEYSQKSNSQVPEDQHYVLTFSAKSPDALKQYVKAFTEFLEIRPNACLRDIAYTLHHKREHFNYRRAIVCKNREEALLQLRSDLPIQTQHPTELIFMFPGQGSQYFRMATVLYHSEPVFRSHVEECCRLIPNGDFRGFLFQETDAPLIDTQKAQPALFIICYALSKFLEHFGIVPKAYIGHSVGEYVAATLCGVFTLAEAVQVVVKRSQLMQQMEKGILLSVQLDRDHLSAILPQELEICAYNSSQHIVVGGTEAAVETFKKTLESLNIPHARLSASHAFHTKMMENAAKQFQDYLNGFDLKKPNKIFYSNVTGEVAGDDVASAGYWANHMRQSVRFSQGIESIKRDFKNPLFVEAGPGKALSLFVGSGISTLPNAKEARTSSDDRQFLYKALGKLWCEGCLIRWPLEGTITDIPLYQFEKIACRNKLLKKEERVQPPSLLSSPAWQTVKRLSSTKPSGTQEVHLIFKDNSQVIETLIHELRRRGHIVFEAAYDFTLAQIDIRDQLITLNPECEEHYRSLASYLINQQITSIVHAWTCVDGESSLLYSLGFCSLYLLQNVIEKLPLLKYITCLAAEVHQVTGSDRISPLKGLIVGALRTLSNELQLVVSLLDIGNEAPDVVNAIAELRKLSHHALNLNFAIRAGYLWQEKRDIVHVEANPPSLFSDKEVILISGGLGGIGLAIAKEISRHHQATLILVGRNAHLNEYQQNALALILQNRCHVELCYCDISDKQALEKAIHQAELKCGAVSAVIHAAGAPAVKITERNLNTIRQSFKGKVDGGQHLYEVFKNKPLKIFAMTSSLASVLGDIGRLDYCASNSYLDVLSSVPSRFRMLSINWPGWSGVGMSRFASPSESNLLTEAEGAALFYRLLNGAPCNQVIVSKIDPSAIHSDLKQMISSDRERMAGESILKDETTTPLEDQLAKIYSQILGSHSFSKCDQYFELGGNSLSAIRLIHQIKKEFQISVTLDVLYKEGSVESLARYLENHLARDNVRSNPLTQTKGVLSSAQERLWFLEKFEGGGNAYHIPLIFDMTHTSVDSLKLSLKRIVNRHEVLRTLIREDREGNAEQHMDSGDGFIIRFYQLPNAIKLDQELEKEIHCRFDLSKEYPIRASFFDCEGRIYLCIVIHHIAFDGWSVDLFLNELEILYQYHEYPLSHEPKLPALTIQYADFARWQRDFLKGHVLEKQLSYWRNKLQDYEILNLKLDKERPSMIDYRGRTIRFEIDKQTAHQLRSLSKNSNTTLYTILLSGFFLLLKTCSEQNDLIIGTPAANRHYEGVEHLIGFFVNALAIRIAIRETETLSDLIKKVSEEVIQAQLYQDLPFEKLVEELQIEKDISRHPLFEVMFGVQHFANKSSWKFYHPERDLYEAAKFDLSVFFDDSGECLRGTFNYRLSLFDQVTIDQWIAQYITLLGQLAIENTSMEVSQFLSKVFVEKPLEIPRVNHHDISMIEQWNDTDKELSCSLHIYQQFEEQARCFPLSIALVCGEVSLTYRELNHRVNRLAHYLIENHRMHRDKLVGLCFDRNIHMMIAIMAVLKAGGAYIPLDPTYSQERMAYLVNDASLEIVLTEQKHLGRDHGQSKSRFVAIDTPSFEEKIADFAVVNPNRDVKSTDLAYVLYTSGTTGQPKGVLIEHQAFATTLDAIKQRFFEDCPCISTFSLTSCTFDIFGLEYALSLCTGGTLTLGEKDFVSLDCRPFDFIQMTPSLADLKLEEMKETSHLILMIGGEKLSGELFEKLKNTCRLIAHVYGPTETTIWSTASNSLTIGKPLSNEKVYVLDQDKKFLPIGEKGELYIGGSGVARGYLNKPELTCEKFVVNPFQTEEEKHLNKNAKLYRTGDLARWLPNGELEFLGREDFQVKIKGHRIELGEVETAIASHPRVHQAVVIADGQLLTAYYRADAPLENTDLFAHLVQKIPSYMIPDSFYFIEEWPLTLAGKIDRNQLNQPNTSPEKQHVKPTNEIQSRLRVLWAELLKVPEEEISIVDSFFSLGGNSLSVIKMVRKVKQSFQTSLSIADVFIYRTIELLAERLRKKNSEFQLIVPLNQSVDKPLLFMIHPAAGGYEVYTSLAKAMEGHFYCCGIDSYNLHHEQKISCLHELAAYYLKHVDELMIERRQPTYHFLGWSLGGKIALEMASVLEQRNPSPEIKLYLIDPVLYENFKEEMGDPDSEEQIEGYRQYAEHEGYEKDFIEKVIGNMSLEQKISEQPVSAILQKSDIVLFKATEKDTRFHSFERLSTHVLNLPYNHLDLVVHHTSSIQLVPVKSSHHGNILKQDRLITTHLTKGKV